VDEFQDISALLARLLKALMAQQSGCSLFGVGDDGQSIYRFSGSVGDSYDNALAETINGLYKAEVIHRPSWKNREAVELATLAWGDGVNQRRLLQPVGNIPPAEAEAVYYRQLTESAIAA
jgi:hypothetical protein